jgi:mono/diheme cytochrome c family protein
MRLRARIGFLLVVLVGAISCRRRFPSEGMTLGGTHVDYATLRNGWSAYGVYCANCHGDRGDGRGPVGIGMNPSPRDFRRGVIKYASVPSGQLPTDDDLLRTIRNGLAGTPMRGWPMPDEEARAIVQYLKTFSDRWRTGRSGVPISRARDPWQGREAEAQERGERIYHATAQCFTCHPGYLSREEMVRVVFAQSGMQISASDLRPELDEAVVQTTDWGTRVMPTDFRGATLKSGNSVPDVYRTIAAGVGGTSMPAWQGVLPEEDLWALAHYVQGLTVRR